METIVEARKINYRQLFVVCKSILRVRYVYTLVVFSIILISSVLYIYVICGFFGVYISVAGEEWWFLNRAVLSFNPELVDEEIWSFGEQVVQTLSVIVGGLIVSRLTVGSIGLLASLSKIFACILCLSSAFIILKPVVEFLLFSFYNFRDFVDANVSPLTSMNYLLGMRPSAKLAFPVACFSLSMLVLAIPFRSLTDQQLETIKDLEAISPLLVRIVRIFTGISFNNSRNGSPPPGP